MTPRIILALLIVALAGCGGESTPSLVDQAASSRLDSTLSAMITSGQAAGVSALVYEGGEEAYFGAFGLANRELGSVMDRETIVQIYSMTKPLTGVALMTLWEDGAFALDDELADYLPEYRDVQVWAGWDQDGEAILEPPRRAITVRDITRHTAGFSNEGSDPRVGRLLAAADIMNPGNTLADMSEALASVPLAYQPGQEWMYGPSVDVQARLVEVLSGRTFEDYLQDTVLDPLGMQETGYVVADEDAPRAAMLYNRSEEEGLTPLPEARAFNQVKQALTPGGWGLTSTLDDYMRFARMLLGGGELEGVRVLQPETIALMATNQLDESITERMWLPSKGQVGFGIDFAVRLRPPSEANEAAGMVGEFFWDGAASTLFWVDPANDLVAVFFVQIFPFSGFLHKAVRDAVYGVPDPGSYGNVSPGPGSAGSASSASVLSGDDSASSPSASSQREPSQGEFRNSASAIISEADAVQGEFDWGTLYTYYEGEAFGTKDGLAAVASIHPGMEIHPPHQHVEEEYLIVTEGTGTWSLNGEPQPAQAGDMLYASPWDWHGITNTGDTPLRFVVWKFNAKNIELPAQPAN